jgi:hypothetical protein
MRHGAASALQTVPRRLWRRRSCGTVARESRLLSRGTLWATRSSHVSGLDPQEDRGGGDRKLTYSTKPHCFMALQPPFRNNWYKQYKRATGDENH